MIDITKTVDDVFEDNGWETDCIVLRDYDYADAIIGISHDGRPIYSYEKMVEWLMLKDNISKTEAIESIEYNIINTLGRDGYPIVMFDRKY